MCRGLELGADFVRCCANKFAKCVIKTADALKATPCGVYLEDKKVVGLQILSDGKIWDCGAKIVLDCTAEATVAWMAGCATQCGRDTDGQMQPYSLVSMVYTQEKYTYTNVDFGRVNQYDPVAFSAAERWGA